VGGGGRGPEGSESDGGAHLWQRRFMSVGDEDGVKATKKSTHAGTVRIERRLGPRDACLCGSHVSRARRGGQGSRVSAVHCSHIASDDESHPWARLGGQRLMSMWIIFL
jgi:hypothetical protein